MSWIQQQTGPPLQQQQYPPTTTSMSAVAGGVVTQNSTAKFVQQQWQQPPQPQQQQQYYFNQQQQHSMQQPQQPGSNQSNWFNPTLNVVPQQQAQNNWQQQQLMPAPPTPSNSEYFIKQQHQQHPAQLDNFMSTGIHDAIQQKTSSHYQPIPPYPIQSNPTSLQQPNLTGITQNSFLNAERETMASTSQQQQHFENIDNHQHQQQQHHPPPQGNSNNNDGWENEWEWNESNQHSQQQLVTNPQLQLNANTFNANIIEESFKTEPNDNWQWNIEEPKKMAIQPAAITKELKNTDIFNNLEVNTNENRRQSLENPQNFNQILPGCGLNSPSNSRNFQSLPIDPTVSNPENNQNPANSSSNVFVSQAKPVSQPPRQFASPPGTTTSGSIEKITSMPLPATTINPNIVAHPISSQSPGLTNVPPPPAAQTPPQSGALPPPPPLLTQNKNAAGNPFKRSGLPQHHRATGLIASVQSPTVMPQQNQQQSAVPAKTFFAPPPPPDEFQNVQSSFLSISSGNQEIISPDNSEMIIAERQLENQEIVPSNDRNQYLQTSHLSEEDFTVTNTAVTHNTRIDGIGAQNNDNDNLPPPGLSRLVLGQPEIDNGISSSGEIPPGFDRMVPGTELVSSSSLNLERQADGQDTIPSPRSAFTNVPPVESIGSSSNIDITSDRNLYLVPGESEHQEQQQQLQQQQPQAQRVVTGLENDTLLTQQSSGEQRELELDGENLEDVQQSQLNNNNFKQNDIDFSIRDEPLEGANTSDILASSNQNQNNNSNETESSLTIETHPKDLSNPSTANDESDNRNHFIKTTSRRIVAADDKIKKRGNKENIDKRKERYESEESDISIERERRRHVREGSMRNDRGNKDNRDGREKDRREKHETGNTRDGDRDERRRYGRDDKERYTGHDSKRMDRDRRDRVNEKYDKNSRRYAGRYETDSKYETEASRYERNRKDGSDRERDREKDRYDDHRRDDKDRRKYRRTGDGDRHAEERRDRRRGGERNDYKEERSDRQRTRIDKNRNDCDEEYRKNGSGSRNARDSDREKDRTTRAEKDSRYSQMYGYPTGAYNYDAYTYYQQQQQYYEQLRRSNPQAYSEWYRKYYGAQGQSTDMGLTATDGRESVHSGRSSANNEKDRYSLHHQQQYIPHHPSDYHHHFLQQSNISSTPNVSMNIEQQQPIYHLDLNNGFGSSSSGNLVHQQQQQQQQQQQFQLNQLQISGYLGGSITGGRNRSYYAQSEYSESRPENLSLNLIGDGASLVNQEPQRLTPFKYTNDHSTVSFSAGLLICVKPKYSQNGITNIVKILRLGSNDSTRRLFQTFPGPLIRGLTHKKTIIEYCEDQIRLGPPSTIRSRQNSMSSLCSTTQMNKASFTLMWNLLILLLRQNGMVVGTDIAELLMKNKNQFPYEFTSSNVSATKSSSLRLGQNDFSNLNENIGAESDSTRKDKIINSNADDSNDGDSMNSNEDQQVDTEINSNITLSEEDITEKFRNYLLYGNVNEALEWATDNNLWGHALFLASKVDRRSHANVMMKFANKLQLNDPLQTLYQLMSGRTPSSVTSVQDEKWGDWRPHLAMILSNTSQRPDLDRKSITTLGDSLYNRGDLFGAQFCYLMAQVGFGKYSSVNPNETTFISSSHNNAVRLILLGSSHHKMFKEFATNEAIMMTEIYEYACSLNDEKFSIIEFQPYKYLLATRMLDYGYQLKTLMYMEQIALHIQRDPSKYEPTFIEKIHTLADRLKYYDPVLEKTMDDQNQNIGNDFPEGGDTNQQTMEDQKWLQDLRSILNEYKTDIFQGNYNNTPNYPPQISGNGIVDNKNYETTVEQNRAAIDQQFVEINQQFSKLTMQYNNFDPMKQTLQQDHQIGDENNANNLQGQLSNTQQQHFSQFYNPNEANVGQIQRLANDGNSYGDGNNIYTDNNFIQSQQQNVGFEQQQQQFISLSDQQQHQPDSLSLGTGLPNQGNYEYWDNSQQLAQNESVTDKNIIVDNKKTSSPQNYIENIVQKKPVTNTTITNANINLISNKLINAATVIANKQNNSIVHNNCSKLNFDKNSLSTTSTVIKQNTNNITFPPQIMKPLNNPSFSTANNNSDILKLINSSDVGKTINPEKFNNYLPNMSTSVSTSSLALKEQQVQEKDDVPRPTISLPNSNSGKNIGYYGGDDDGQNKNESTKQMGTAGGAKQKGNKNDNKNTNKSGNIAPASQNSGWFGGIWNKLSLKPKNQMILPDDKNPAIVWDSEKKKWVNTDGEDAEQEQFKPPPKMGDVLPASVPTMQSPPVNNYNSGGQQNTNIPQHQEQQVAQIMPQLPAGQTIYGQTMQQLPVPLMTGQGQQMQPQNVDLTQNYNTGVINNNAPSSIGNTVPVHNAPTGEATTKTPNLQSNMFKMQRNRTLKKSYVDVFNPSGAPSKPLEPVLAPAIPSTIPQSGYFIPAPVSGDSQQHQQDGGPQFYNPNQFGGYQQ